ncbi:hypothetical protein [Streptosporangium sp. G12]
MMSARPLGVWVATTRPLRDGSAARRRGDIVNDGDERADARWMPGFASGWERCGVLLDTGEVLGLRRDGTAELVVEVDECAAPVPVTREELAVVARLEENWPEAVLRPADLATMARADVTLRRLLVGRLAQEGTPPPEIYHLLPWELVDRLAAQALSMVRGGRGSSLVFLRDWFVPVGSRFSAALEQLDEGLRAEEPELIHLGAAALCVRLRDIAADRLPPATRQVLAQLVRELPNLDRFIADAAGQAVARLEGAVAPRSPLRLDTRLNPAANTSEGVRRETTDAVREPFSVRLGVTSRGRVEIRARTAWAAADESLLAAYGAMFLPVLVSGPASSARHLILLRVERGELSGRLGLVVPSGDWVEIEVTGPPLGIAEISLVPPEDVRRSVRGATTNSVVAEWTRIAREFPENHPLRLTIEDEL